MTSAARTKPVAGRRVGWHSLTVSDLDRLSEDATAITLTVPARLAAVYAHRAGQHVVVRHRGAQRELRRSYSICPPPRDPGRLRLVVRRGSPEGFGNYAATRLAVGRRLEVSPPTGTFGLIEGPGVHHVLLAGGTGITPLLAMAASALREDPQCRVSLLYASRSSHTALLADELGDLKDAHLDRFTVLHVLSRERREAELLSGRIDGDRLLRLLGPLGARPGGTETAYYLCGPSGLVDSARRALSQAGAAPERIRLELFATDGAPTVEHVDRRTRITARIGGRTSQVEMRASEDVLLDAVLRVRPEAPYACRAGLCGSCRARVVQGAATLGRQYALGPAEIATGYTLACVARPATDEITLDFDG